MLIDHILDIIILDLVYEPLKLRFSIVHIHSSAHFDFTKFERRNMPNHIKHLSRPTWWQSRPLQSLLQTLPRTLHTAPQTNQQPPPRPSSASRANLDTSTPPRAQKTNGKSSSRKPRGDIAPTGIWGLGPVTLAFALVVLSGAGWFGCVRI